MLLSALGELLARKIVGGRNEAASRPDAARRAREQRRASGSKVLHKNVEVALLERIIHASTHTVTHFFHEPGIDGQWFGLVCGCDRFENSKSSRAIHTDSTRLKLLVHACSLFRGRLCRTQHHQNNPGGILNPRFHNQGTNARTIPTDAHRACHRAMSNPKQPAGLS